MWLREVCLWDINQSDLFLNFWFISLSWVRHASLRAYKTVWEKLSGKGVKAQCEHLEGSNQNTGYEMNQQWKGWRKASVQQSKCHLQWWQRICQEHKVQLLHRICVLWPWTEVRIIPEEARDANIMKALSRSKAQIRLNYFTIPTEPEEPSKICIV